MRDEDIKYINDLEERVQELEGFINRFIKNMSNQCIKEHIKKYRTDIKLMRNISRHNEPPSYLSMTDKLALISFSKVVDDLVDKNKRYLGALKFYADEKNYEDIGIPTGNNPPALPILEDRGQVARKELEGEQ